MTPSSASSAYTAQLRLLLCSHCGAPIEGAPEGGIVQCRFCSAQSRLAARSELPAFAAHAPVAISEQERILRLRAQDGRPLSPPPSLLHLFGPGGEIPAWREQEVFAVWQTARKRTATLAPDAAEELFFLTQVLGNQFVRSQDWTRHRAMLESSLEALFLPRHRSTIAADLCMGACRQGDIHGAEQWLSLTDATTDDLFADSSHRMAKARVATLKREFDKVLGTLGHTADEVPIHDALDCLASVYRAHAWEQLGRTDVAVRELEAELAKGSQQRDVVEAIVKLHGVCPASFPRALGTTMQNSAAAAEHLASGGIDKVFVPLGKGMIGCGAVGFLLAVVGAVILVVGAVTRSMASFAGLPLLMGGGIAGTTFLVMGFVFAGIGKSMGEQAKRARVLATEGLRARGTVLSVQPTGVAINGVPQFVVRVRVDREGVAPYEAQLKMLSHPHQMASLAGGSVIALRVSPRDPTEIAPET